LTVNGWVVAGVGAGAGGVWYLGYPGAAAIVIAAAMLLLLALGWRLLAARSGELRLSVEPPEVHRGDEVRVSAGEVRGLVYATVTVLGCDSEMWLPREWRMPASHRGRFRSQVTRGERVGPLWLARRRLPGSPPTETTVLPRRYPLAEAPSMARTDRGDRAGTERGGTVFESLREYVDGDDIRLVHWAASARTADGSLLVRQHALSRTSAFLLVFDPDPQPDPEPGAPEGFETAVDLAYSLAHAIRQPTLLTLRNGRIVAPTGPDAIGAVLTVIEPCRVPAADGRSACLATLLREARRRSGGHTTVVVVSAGATSLSPLTRLGAPTILFRVRRASRAQRLGMMTVFDVPDLAAAGRAWATVMGR
jgi:uncharacterized protein (DUF58 family)